MICESPEQIQEIIKSFGVRLKPYYNDRPKEALDLASNFAAMEHLRLNTGTFVKAIGEKAIGKNSLFNRLYNYSYDNDLIKERKMVLREVKVLENEQVPNLSYFTSGDAYNLAYEAEDIPKGFQRGGSNRR